MRIPSLAATAVVLALASPLLSTMVEAQAKPAQAPAPRRKSPSAKEAEAFPDAATLAARRTAAQERRLFQHEEPLAVTLAADFKAIDRGRDGIKTFPAVLSVPGDEGGVWITLPVTLRTRGNFRRLATTCASPPLFVEFDKPSVKHTAFDGQKKLKLLVNCNENPRSDQMVLLEYAAYRLYNVMTPWSFRVRRAVATYADPKTGEPISTHNAVFVEDDDDVSARMDGRAIALTGLLFKDFDQTSLNQMAVFQYMIGNPDYSVSFMHNVRMVQTATGVRYPITWDFDVTGFVDPQYASPIPQVRQVVLGARIRRYLGPCLTAEQFEPTLAAFRAKQAELMGVVTGLPGLDDAERGRVTAYLGEFFTTIGNPELVKRELIDNCHDRTTS